MNNLHLDVLFYLLKPNLPAKPILLRKLSVPSYSIVLAKDKMVAVLYISIHNVLKVNNLSPQPQILMSFLAALH